MFRPCAPWPDSASLLFASTFGLTLAIDYLGTRRERDTKRARIPERAALEVLRERPQYAELIESESTHALSQKDILTDMNEKCLGECACQVCVCDEVLKW